jgi:hypothetical protein
MPFTEEDMARFREELERDSLMDPVERVDEYVPETGTFVDVPKGAPRNIINAENRFVQGENQDNIVGDSWFNPEKIYDWLDAPGGFGDIGDLRGAGAALMRMTVGTLGMQVEKFGEQLNEPSMGIVEATQRAMDGELSAFWEYAMDKNPLTSGFMVSAMPEPMRDYLRDQGVVERSIEAGRSIQDWNKRFIAEVGLGLGPDEDATFLYRLSEGATSLVGSLGLLYVTRSPAAAAAVFGYIEGTSAYNEARDRGKGVEGSTLYGHGQGALTYVLEKVGGEIIMSNLKIPGMGSRVFSGAMGEGLTEASQGFSQETLAQLYDVRKGGGQDAFQQAFSGFVYGALLGGPTAGVAGFHQDAQTRDMLGNDESRYSLAEMMVEGMTDTALKEFRMHQEASSGAKLKMSEKIRKDQKVVKDILKAAMTGIDIDTVYKSETRKQKDIESFITDLDKAAKTSDLQRKGFRKEALRRESQLLEELTQIEEEGGQLVDSVLSEIDDGKLKAKILKRLGTENVVDDLYDILEEKEVQDALEGSSKYKKIEERSNKIRDRLAEVQLELAQNEGALAGRTDDTKTGDEAHIPIGPSGKRKFVGATFYHTTDSQSAEQIRSDGFRVVGDGYYGDAISLTDNKEYSSQFGEETLTVELKSNAKIYDQSNPEQAKKIQDVQNSREFQAASPTADGARPGQKTYGEVYSENGIDGIYDDGAGDLFIFNPKVIKIAEPTTGVTLEELKGRDILVKGGSIEVAATKAAVAALKDGIRYGTKSTKENLQEAQKIFKDAVKALPKSLDLTTGRRTQLMSRSIRVTPKNIERMIKNMQRDAQRSMYRGATKLAIEHIKSKLIKNKDQKSYRVQDTLNAIAPMNTKNADEVLGSLEAKYGDDIEGPELHFGRRYAYALMNPRTPYRDWVDLLEDIEHYTATGIQGFQNMAKEKAAIRESVISKLEKKSGKRISEDTSKTTITQAVLASAGYVGVTYNTTLERLGLMDSPLNIDKSSMSYRKGIMEKKATLIQKIESSLGKKFMKNYFHKAKRADDLVLEEVIQETGKEAATERLTKPQAVQRYMELQNPHVRESIIEGMGYTEAHIQKIENYIGPEGQDLADILFEMYEDSYDEINDVYRRINGVSLPKVGFYAKINRDFSEAGQQIDIDGVKTIFSFFEPSALKPRKNSKRPLKKGDALDVFLRYSHNTQQYVSFAEFYQEADAILQNSRSEKALVGIMGKSGYDKFKQHVKMLRTSKYEFSHQAMPAIDYLRDVYVKSTLGLNPQIGLKQLTSVFAFSAGISSGDFISGVSEFFSNPVKHWNEMVAHDTIKYRGKNFMNEMLDAEMNSYNNRAKKIMRGEGKFLDFAMISVRLGDKLPLIMGGYAHMRALEKRGMSREMAMDKAMNLAEQSQQSTLEGNLPLAQKEGNSMTKLVMMFTSSPIALMNMQMKALHKLKNKDIGPAEFLRTVSIYQMIIPSFFGMIAQALNPADEEEREQLAALTAQYAILGPWASLPLFGGGLEFVGHTAAELIDDNFLGDKIDIKQYQRSLADDRILDAGKMLVRESTKIVNGLAGNEPVTYMELLESLALIADQGVALPIDNTTDILKGVWGIAEDREINEDDVLRILGYSDFARKQKGYK